jgi:hypothetical protein
MIIRVLSRHAVPGGARGSRQKESGATPHLAASADQKSHPREAEAMRKRPLSTWAFLLLALVMAVALAAAVGCGGDSTSSSGGSPAATTASTDLTAEQIVQQSDAKMKEVTSASFTADMALKVQGDPSKMTDPTEKALLSQGIDLHVEGKSASDPLAVDMTMSVGISGQSLDVGMMAQGDKAWVEYQGKWYAVDQKSTKGLSEQAKNGAAPTEQLKSLGLDPSTWGTTYELVGTEDLNGTQVYHVKAAADPQKLADALMKAASDPNLAKKLGGASTVKQLEQGLAQNDKQLQALKKSLTDVSVDYWVGVDDLLMRKADFNAVLTTKGQKGMQGVDGMTLDLAVTMADFGVPVTVSPPANAQSLDKLMNQMFGGMTSGSGLGI